MNLSLRKIAQGETDDLRGQVFALEVGIAKLPEYRFTLGGIITDVHKLICQIHDGHQTASHGSVRPGLFQEEFFWLGELNNARTYWKGAFRDLCDFFEREDIQAMVSARREGMIEVGNWGTIPDHDNEDWSSLEEYTPDIDVEMV